MLMHSYQAVNRSLNSGMGWLQSLQKRPTLIVPEVGVIYFWLYWVGGVSNSENAVQVADSVGIISEHCTACFPSKQYWWTAIIFPMGTIPTSILIRPTRPVVWVVQILVS